MTAVSPSIHPVPERRAETMLSLLSRLSEVGAVVGVGIYAFGLLRVSGQLRELDLSAPAVIASFSHPDMLMFGAGAMVSQISGAIVLGIIALLLLSADLLRSLNAVSYGTADHRAKVLVGAGILAILLVAGSRMWVGSLFVVVAMLVLTYHLVLRKLVAHTTLLLLLLFGIIFTGVFGAYLNPAPPMNARLDIASATDPNRDVLTGKFLGTSTDNQWVIAEKANGDAYDVRLVPITPTAQLKISEDARAQDHYRVLGVELWRVLT